MSKPIIIGVVSSEGYRSTIYQDPDSRVVYFKGDADIDADGANGQTNKVAAYMRGNKGSEHCANGGMRMLPDGRLVGDKSWFKDIVITDDRGQPFEFEGGIYGSKTAYKYPNFDVANPAGYLDSETVPYIAIPPMIVQKTGKDEIIMGCMILVKNRSNGKQAWGMVGDIGPRTKVGEVSIQMARDLGINSSPRYGGEDRPILDYEIYPNCHALIHGVRPPLITSKGKYIYA